MTFMNIGSKIGLKVNPEIFGKGNTIILVLDVTNTVVNILKGIHFIRDERKGCLTSATTSQEFSNSAKRTL